MMRRSHGRQFISRGGFTALVVCCAALTFSPVAAAEGQTGERVVGAELPPPRIVPWTEPWSEGTSREFVAARVDVGLPFAQAHLFGGYGKPHYFWGGIEVGALASSRAASGLVGLRFEHPIIDVRSSFLYVVGLSRSFLEPKDSYDRRDIDDRSGVDARYPAWDNEAKLTVPIGFGAVQSETEAVWIPEQDGQLVYLDILRVVEAPSWVGRQRLAYEFRFPGIEGLRFAPAAEVVWIPERDDEWVVRAGLLTRFWLFHDLELRVDLLPVVASPDALGNQGGEPLRIALRWQWATP
jgi:hypothetical protein